MVSASRSAPQRRRRGFVGTLLGALLGASALLLAACSGDSVRGEFARTFGDDPAVAGFELSTADNQPFTGGLRADVRVQPSASDDALRGLVDRLSGFDAARSGTEVRITVRTPTLTVPIFAEATTSAATIEAALDLAAVADVGSVELTAADDQERVSAVRLQLERSAPSDYSTAFALAREIPDRLATIAVASGPHITLRDPAAHFTVQGPPGTWWLDAEATLLSLTDPAPAVRVAGVRASPDSIVITVGDESEVPAATARLAEHALTSDYHVAFASPQVSLGTAATGAPARALVDGLGDTERATVESLWTDDARATFTAASPADAEALASALSARPEATAFELLTVIVGAPDDPELSVTSEPSQLGALTAQASAMLDGPGITAITVSPRKVTVTVPQRSSTDALQAQWVTLERLAEPGARLCAERPDGTAECGNAPR